uniref:Aspartate aminotransferase n=1 Tax=Nephromyces sp. MMRI TaxID=2496275 RepID=A0A3S8V354_9APIC|nr:cytosolic aspartate aminotransferase [Nephromyces sp. MMRI]
MRSPFRLLTARMSSLQREIKNGWSHVSAAPADPILGLTQLFLNDKNPSKVNLGVGAYRDENGKPWVLPSVRMAEASRFNFNEQRVKDEVSYEYIPIEGIPGFVENAVKLAYSPDIAASKAIAAVQSVSGTGALRIAAEWLKRFYDRDIFIPAQSWANHNGIMTSANLNVKTYRYWDKTSLGLDFRSMLEDIQNAEDGSIILLHACAHNPTGCDPTQDEWKEMEQVIRKKKQLVLFDMAYQGFASGDTDEDAWAVRYFINQGHSIMLCQSFAKNMGLYGQRVGTFSFICSSEEEKRKCISQVKRIIRSMYSSPPRFGAEIAKHIFENQAVREQWLNDVKAMANRVHAMRIQLYNLLKEKHNIEWKHITLQKGMFAYTGLTETQVKALADQHHIYMTSDGRASIPGLNASNVEYVADCFAAVVKQ